LSSVVRHVHTSGIQGLDKKRDVPLQDRIPRGKRPTLTVPIKTSITLHDFKLTMEQNPTFAGDSSEIVEGIVEDLAIQDTLSTALLR
jgi:hypothetical protein